MSKTPIQNGSKASPGACIRMGLSRQFKSDLTRPVGKHLLTPCRQAGLSRIKKTPATYNSNTESNNSQGSSEAETTPLSTKIAVEVKDCNVREKRQSRNNRVSKRLIDDEEPKNGDQNDVNKEPLSLANNLTCGKVNEESLTPFTSNEKSPDFVFENNPKLKTYNRKKRVSKRLIAEENDELTADHTSKKVCADSANDRLSQNVAPENKSLNDGGKIIEAGKRAKNTNKTKKESGFNPETAKEECKEGYKNTEEHKAAISIKENYEKSTLKDIKNANPERLSEPLKKQCNSKNNKLKRSLSMKKSSEDYDNKEDFPEELTETMISRDITANDVRELQKQIKDKQSLIDDLKKAEMLRKKHDLNELSALTAIWKKGCIAALNDLLPEVQNYTSIDMPTLLTNLNIPKEIITLNSDGELI